LNFQQQNANTATMNTDTPETDKNLDGREVIDRIYRERDEEREQRDALKDIFPQILIALQSGGCTADCSVNFLQEIPKEVRLVRERLERELAEEREETIRWMSIAEGRNAKDVAAAETDIETTENSNATLNQL
jgi:chlorite dismutase